MYELLEENGGKKQIRGIDDLLKMIQNDIIEEKNEENGSDNS
jgi:hypothetical protein